MRRFTLFSIDNSRRHYTDSIRSVLKGHGWAEMYTRCVNASRYDDLEKEIALSGVKVNPVERLTRGEVAIWMTMLNGIVNAPVVTIEDDALVDVHFTQRFDEALSELPEDADFFSLFTPRDSDHMFTEEHSVSGCVRVCKAYQRYGGVSMYITMRGAQNIRRLVSEDGILDQWDNQLYKYSREGRLNGYTSMPHTQDIVWITGSEPTTVHNTERWSG